MKKALPYIFLAVLVIVALLIKRCNNTPPGRSVAPSTTRKDDENVNRNRGLDRRVRFLDYTQHAKCRMECRHITQEEVQYILQNGQINYRKSEAQARPCPTYALEGYSPDKQHLRIVFAQCDTKTKVVTCIDLDTEFECHCPGDENKHER
ncbi:MAG TPA: DUF4258 domain-containing protein [Chitinophagaceae bacterium]|nr:DUF4258 domain-containing protein [Chitinophagaceae bacterium]